jgi:hypothetical protein
MRGQTREKRWGRQTPSFLIIQNPQEGYGDNAKSIPPIVGFAPSLCWFTEAARAVRRRRGEI